MDKLIMVASKTLKLLLFILKNIFKATGWLWKHRKAVKEKSVIALFSAVTLFLCTQMLISAKLGVEVCDGSKGMFTIEEEGIELRGHPGVW